MNNIIDVRCPHCKVIYTINVKEEIEKHKEPVYRMIKIPKIDTPITITVPCSNCKKPIKIKVA